MPLTPGADGTVRIDQKSGTGASGVLSFTGIPGTCRSLRLVVVGRSTVVATSANVGITFEASPTAGAYNSQGSQAQAAVVTAFESVNASSIFLGYVSGASSPASAVSSFGIDLDEYAATDKFKTIRSVNAGIFDVTTTTLLKVEVIGIYEIAAALSRIDLTLSAGNWDTISRATLYGLI